MPQKKSSSLALSVSSKSKGRTAPAKSQAGSSTGQSSRAASEGPLLWALDVFEKEEDQALQQCAEWVLSYATRLERQVQPVYILSPEQLGLPFDLEASSLRQYQTSSTKALAAMVARLPESLRNSGLLGEGTILVQKRASLTESAKQLGKYALKVSAAAVFVSSHARTGLPRLFLGSFAESLLLTNPVPTIIIPRTRSTEGDPLPAAQNTPLILFASDLSAKSKGAFQQVVQIASDMGARIALYHSIQNPAEAVVQSGVFLLGGIWTPVPKFLSEARQKIEKQAASWLALAAKKKVSVQLVIDTDSSVGPVNGILQAARSRKAFMVAMAAQSGPVAAVVLGSRTRQVVRESNIPVWVLRTRI